MSLRKKAQTIDKSKIRSGQVLEMSYTDVKDVSKTSMVLVIDPNYNGKMHAIKLINFVEEDLINLIKDIRSTGESRGALIEYQPTVLYEKFINSKYTGRRNYRTYNIENISAVKRITVGQDAPGSKKIRLDNGSVLYGVVHGQYVEIAFSEYDLFATELESVGNKTFHEGPDGLGHEDVVKELMRITVGTELVGTSWEPPKESIVDLAKIGSLVAGWWNETFDADGRGQGFINLKSEWNKWGFSLTTSIGDAFAVAMGSSYNTIIDNFTGYEEFGRYSKFDFLATLTQRAFDDKGNPTEALYDFNQAGHDQVFPEDQDPPLPPGKLKAVEQEFNLARDKYLLEKMRRDRGVYFAGSGHIDNIRKLL